MTRGHIHARAEQAEYYFGLCGRGLLLLQDMAGVCRLEQVFAGSVHHIPATLPIDSSTLARRSSRRWRSGLPLPVMITG